MALNASELGESMLQAAKGSLSKDWPKVKDYAEPEFKKLAQSMVEITALVAAGKANDVQAKALLQIHANTARIVMLTVEGMGLLAVERAMNAALDAARQVLKAAGVAFF